MGLRPFWGGLPGGGADRHRVEQRLEAGEDADEGEAGGRGIEPAGAVPGEAAPVGQPAEAPLHHPAAGEHDEALGLRVAGYDAVAHPVDVRPFAAALGRERGVVDALPQGGPARLAGVQRLQRVPVLHRGRHDGDREPVPLGVHQRHPLAPEHLLAGVVPARAADGDALHRLRVDDGQRRPRPPPALAPPATRHLAQQGVEQAQLEPAPEPAVHGPPRRPAGRQGAPGAAHPQMPGDRADHAPDRRRPPAPRRVGPLQPRRDLLHRARRHQLLQARLVPRPVRLRPHPVRRSHPRRSCAPFGDATVRWGPQADSHSNRWGDWGSRPGDGCSAKDGGAWSVGIGHEHRGGAAVKHFAGLDVSLDETTVCVVDEAGGIVREARVPSEPEALVAFFRGLGLAMERIGLEACSLAAWLHEGLTAAGLPAVWLETRRGEGARGAMPNKTDRNDARGIAQIVRTGWFRAVHVKSPACRSWRALLAARRLVLNKMRDLENGVRAPLREAGLKLGRPARKELAARVRELVGADAVLSASAEPLLAIIAAMTHELAQLTKRVLDIVRDEPVCRRLTGVPGVGPLTALTFRATIDRPDRFRRSRDVGAHLGLTPKRYQSGETDVQGGISRCGDELARTALYEAAHSLLVRSRKWSTLRAWGMQVAKRRGMARARVAVARKLAVVLHRVWADGAEFRWGKEDADVAPAAPA